MGAPKVKVPGPSEEERALQKQQAEMLALQRDIIKQQQQQNAVMLPFLAEQQGFEVTTDANGNITSIKKKFDELEEQAREIQKLSQERSIKALKGELPVDPALEEDLKTQEETLRNKLATQFGPGYETSSPAIEAMEGFRRSAEILREGARTGQLTLAEQIGLSREQERIYKQQTQQEGLLSQATGLPLSLAGAFGQVAKGYGAAQAPFIAQRQMQTQASIANAQAKTSLLGAGIGAIGGIFGMFSDADMKGDLVIIGKTEAGLPIYEYTRIDTGERMIGVLSRDVEKLYPWAVGTKGGYDVVDYSEV